MKLLLNDNQFVYYFHLKLFIYRLQNLTHDKKINNVENYWHWKTSYIVDISNVILHEYLRMFSMNDIEAELFLNNFFFWVIRWFTLLPHVVYWPDLLTGLTLIYFLTSRNTTLEIYRFLYNFVVVVLPSVMNFVEVHRLFFKIYTST